MINDILSLIEVATIAINETTILEIKVTIWPFRSSLTIYLSRLMKVKESAKSVICGNFSTSVWCFEFLHYSSL